MLNNILRPLVRQIVQQGAPKRFSHKHSDFKYVTFDEACVPEGSWQENFNKRQVKYNTHLVLGVTAFILTLVSINRFELIFFNYLPPKPKNN